MQYTASVQNPMLLLSNLRIQEKKKLCHIVAKVYLLRWRIEEYSKRIYGVSQFLFYAVENAPEQILTMSHTGISAYMPQKNQIWLFYNGKLRKSMLTAYLY